MPMFNKVFYYLILGNGLMIDDEISNRIAFLKLKRNLLANILNRKPKLLYVEIEGYNFKDYCLNVSYTKNKKQKPLVLISTKEKTISVTM